MGAAGRIIAIVGGIVAILAIVLYHVLPDIFCLWKFDSEVPFEIWLGGFGFQGGILGTELDPESTESIILLIIIILMVAGGAISIIGGVITNKLIGILGGVVTLVGIVLFMIGLLIEFGDFGDIADFISPFGEGLLYGSSSSPAQAGWGLWIGSYMVIGGGAAGLIGGFLIED